jgi:integrase
MPDQVPRLAEATEPRYRLMVLLAAFCSLRFAELVGLERARLDLLQRVVVIEETAVELSGRPAGFGPPKSAAGRRHVTFPPELVELVEQHPATHVGPRPDALVFPGPNGDPRTRDQFRTIGAVPAVELASPGFTSTTCEVRVRPGRHRAARQSARSWLTSVTRPP